MNAAQNFPQFSPYRLRKAFITWQAREKHSHFLTLAINRVVTPDNARKMFSTFCLEVDRHYLGRHNVQSTPSCLRFQAVATIEHAETNIHLHVAAKFNGWIPHPYTASDDEALDKIWRKCTRQAGDFDSRPIGSANGMLHYMTKEQKFSAPEYILSVDFHPI